MGSILSLGIADKRRKLENRAVGVKWNEGNHWGVPIKNDSILF